MEPMCGDLVTVLERRKKLGNDECKYVFRQLLDAVHFLHSHGICHRDIKPDNCLVACDKKLRYKVMSLKLTDFEFACNFEELNTTSSSSVPCGSPCYVAPEICSKNPVYSSSSDVWSLGITLYIMLTGSFPWYHNHPTKLMEMIRSSSLRIPDYVSDYGNNDHHHNHGDDNANAKDLLQKMLEKDSSKRININSIKDHPWLSSSSSSFSPPSVSLPSLSPTMSPSLSPLPTSTSLPSISSLISTSSFMNQNSSGEEEA
eukprot:TRINITY_DN3602_c0_g1_i3.p1 TRINITY_DN3602_c0_g1~~TRINITY_DN3602_c0_g1_i3.p1  ORF type:complete len:258 (-),score=41.24 TRINITY_DN3602_c0_g1_i3:405-1178(-)